jgi:hydroxypyruvate isomerase
MTRRTLFAVAGAAAAAPAAPPAGRLKQSVSKWCFAKMPFDTLCREAARMGLQGIDLVGPEDWPTIKKYGLVPAMTPGAGSIANGFNRKENHEKLVADLRANIDRAAAAQVPNVITFSGNRKGMADQEGMDNCVEGLKRIAAYAEEKGVTVCVELLNSKVDHKDYMADHTAWGAEMCQRVGSPRVKLLYDIYHMQIMEGDVIRTIRQHIRHIGHFHTGGVPGRHEIDETQELCYPAIARAIAELNFQGYFAHEFVPARDPLTSLEQAVKLCRV